MSRILLLRSGSEPVGDVGTDVDVVRSHEIVPSAQGLAEVEAFAPAGATLVISSRTAVKVLVDRGSVLALRGPFREILAAGEETASALREAGASSLRVPTRPGAAGILLALPGSLAHRRILWPRGSDADAAPLEELARRGALVCAPVVYEKRAMRLPPAVVERLCSGGYTAIALGSLAALEVLLAHVPSPPPLRWGVLGPETARALVNRGLPEPLVPEKPRIADLVELLRRETA